MDQAALNTIVQNQTGSITVHKHAQPDPVATERANGKEQNVSSEPLAGATFRLQKVNATAPSALDLATNAGWKNVEAIVKAGVENLPQGYSLGDAVDRTTATDGSTKFDNLELGLYRVEEIASPNGYIAASEPFYITVPMTDPDERNQWMYDLHVYPKNNKVEDVLPSKTVKDAKVQAGGTINYQLNAPIREGKITYFQVEDNFPEAVLEAGDNFLTNVKFNGVEMDSSHYVVTSDPNALGKIRIILTAAGVDFVNASTTGERVITADVALTVKKDAFAGDSSDVIRNEITTYPSTEIEDRPGPDTPPNPDDPNDPDVPPVTPTPEDPNDPNSPPTNPRSFFGNVKLTKQGTDNAPLEGAVFDVYTCNADENGKGILVNKLADFTTAPTNAEGVAYIRGLHANNFVDGAAGTTDPTGYCVVEVKSPEGHSLLAEPVYFQVMADIAADKVELVNLDTAIVNTDDGRFQLPLTGGKGVLLVLGAGMALLLIGGAAYVLRRRQA